MTEAEKLFKKIDLVLERALVLAKEFAFLMEELNRETEKERQLLELGKQHDEWWTQQNDDDEWINKH